MNRAGHAHGRAAAPAFAALASSPETLAAAREAGLRYVADGTTGIFRETQARSVRYRDVNGLLIKDPATLSRIKRLAMPPAWSDVWICPRADGHLQATGRDARRRKQYRYGPWRKSAGAL